MKKRRTARVYEIMNTLKITRRLNIITDDQFPEVEIETFLINIFILNSVLVERKRNRSKPTEKNLKVDLYKGFCNLPFH